MPLRVLAPAGTWRVVERRGIASVSRDRGTIAERGIDSIVVTPAKGSEADWALTLEHQRLGRFSYSRLDPVIDWSVRFFTWRDSTADPPRDSSAFAAVLRGEASFTRQAGRLDYMWYRPTITGIPQERFAIVATGSVKLARGE